MTGFDYNGESNLDLEYAMGLVNPQKVTLLQTGDENVGQCLLPLPLALSDCTIRCIVQYLA